MKAKRACGCGQVLFDLSGRMAGAILSCPWCGRRYRMNEDGALSPEGDLPAAASDVKPADKGRSGRGGGRREDAIPSAGAAADIAERPDAIRPRSRSLPQNDELLPAAGRRDGGKSDIGRDMNDCLGPNIEGYGYIGSGKRVGESRKPDGDGGFGCDVEYRGASEEEGAGGHRPELADPRRGEPDSFRETSGRRPSHVETRMRRMELEISHIRVIKWVFVVGAVIYLVALFFMAATGEVELELRDLKLFGFRISGKNPLLWITAAAFFALLSLAAWAAHTYFFVYLGRGKAAGAGKDSAGAGAKDDLRSHPAEGSEAGVRKGDT